MASHVQLFIWNWYNHLLKTEKLWEYSNVTQASIEINSECNWKCRFCPNHSSPYTKNRMETSLFVEILKKIDSYNKIKNLSLNYYGEPLLDDRLNKKLELILDTQLNLLLFTNGSLINEEFISIIKRFGTRATICMNIPSINEVEFNRLTGYKNLSNPTATRIKIHDKIKKATVKKVCCFLYFIMDFNSCRCRANVICNLELLLQNQIKVQLLVNGTKDNQESNIHAISKRFPSASVSNDHDTVDRAGAVKNEFFQNISVKDKNLFGCRSILHDLQIDIDGNVMVCCHDFYKKHKIDAIQNFDNVDSLLKSENMEL